LIVLYQKTEEAQYKITNCGKTFQKPKNKKFNKKYIEKYLHSTNNYAKLNNAFVKGKLDKKEVNESNEGRNPSQLSADYYYLRLR